MKVNKFCKLALAAASLFTLSAQAADLITFDPTGTAGAAGNLTVGTFDWAPGSALANNVNTTTGLVNGTNFTTYYQANLGIVQNGVGGTVFTNGNSNLWFTAVAGFGETVSGCTSSPCLDADFNFNSSQPNFFNIMKVTGLADNLNGTGFIGTSILSGHVVADGFGSGFTVSNVSGGALDQAFGTSAPWTGVQTVAGTGSSDIQIVVDVANPDYFPDISVGTIISFSFFNTSQNLAFKQVDPSICLTNGIADCQINSDVGTYNGLPIGSGGGLDVIFQADANQSFTKAAVPEPGALALAGLALFGAFVAGRRRRTTA